MCERPAATLAVRACRGSQRCRSPDGRVPDWVGRRRSGMRTSATELPRSSMAVWSVNVCQTRRDAFRESICTVFREAQSLIYSLGGYGSGFYACLRGLSSIPRHVSAAGRRRIIQSYWRGQRPEPGWLRICLPRMGSTCP
jgi:hypothetical protein